MRKNRTDTHIYTSQGYNINSGEMKNITLWLSNAANCNPKELVAAHKKSRDTLNTCRGGDGKAELVCVRRDGVGWGQSVK